MADKNDLMKVLMEGMKEAPQPTAAAPQPTAAAPQPTASAPQPTASAPLSGGPENPWSASAYAPGDTVKAGNKTYTVEKLIASGSEGDIYIVNGGGRRYALKLFHSGYKANTKVLPALEKLKGKGYIADIIACDETFELSEFFPEGNAAGAGVKGNAQAILAIALKTAVALDAMHKAGVLHKDVKPANILIKDRESWDSLLCDFGISDLLDKNGTCATLQLRTPIYAAPEVYTDTVTLPEGICIELTSKADFYSLGMTILSLWMGESAFRAQERVMALDKVKGRIAVPSDMPDPLARICSGLLIKDPAKRWNLDEIEKTLEGKDVPVEESLIIEDLNITYNASKHQIANTPEELAGFMDEDLELAKKYLYRGQVERWLKPYPELSTEVQDIVEKRYPKDQGLGVMAAIYLLDPAHGFPLEGYSRKTGKQVSALAVTFKDVSDFFGGAIPNPKTASLVAGPVFKEWVYSRNKSLAAGLEPDSGTFETYMLRVQSLDPLSDINLRNDPSDPDYAMTGEGLGRLLNKVYHIFWNVCGGDISKVAQIWTREEYFPMNYEVPVSTVLSIAVNFLSPEDYHYVTKSLDTKGRRFEQQRQWFVHCTDRGSDDYQKKAGPKDDIFRAQAAWMKVIKGFGATPEYKIAGTGEVYTSAEAVLSLDESLLRAEYDDRGLRGFLAVCRQEDPGADLSARFAYEDLLYDYLEDLRKIDRELDPVARFDEARQEADRILSEGKAKLRSLEARSVLQRVATVLFAFIPTLILFVMLVFAIIDNPVVDVSKVRFDSYIWLLGIVIAGVVWLWADLEGCLLPIIIGAVSAGLLGVAGRFLGAYILYIFAVLVLAALVFFSIRTVFDTSKYARRARKFSKPGFDEKVLEPLYYAFSSETVFDSSLNGAFNDDEIDNWKGDLRRRRIFMFIFIGAAWLFILLSLSAPKSERFEKFSAPVTDRIEKVFSGNEPQLIGARSLKQGDRGEDVVALQKFLKAEGYTRNSPDGDYGPGTRKAVSEFQLASGLDVTGEADHRTVKAINRHETARALASGTVPSLQAAQKSPAPAAKTQGSAPKTQPAPAKTAPAKTTPAPSKAASPSKPAVTPSGVESGAITLDQLRELAEKNKNK